MIRLFTDTSANLPLSLINKYGITVAHFSYTANGVEADYRHDAEFDGKAFYGAMRAGTIIKTSMVNTDEFLNCFEGALSAGEDVLYIGMSGGISGTANSALVAAKELQGKYPERNIMTIDTYAASLGEGLLVLEAAEMISENREFSEIVRRILARRETMCQYFTVDDLEYLRRGGRLSGTAAFIGSMLNVKPILTGDPTGHIVPCGKAIGSKKAIKTLAEKYARLAADKSERIGIAHADNEEGANKLLGKLRECGFTGECLNVCYEPVTGSHVGPGTIALFFNGTEK